VAVVVAAPQHAVALAQRLGRRQLEAGRVVGMQDPAGQVDQHQAMVDLVEHPGQHGGLQSIGRRCGDLPQPECRAGDFDHALCFHHVLLIHLDEESMEICCSSWR
jgi:hypothetical protein